MRKEVIILIVISLIAGFLIGYGYTSIRINKMEATISVADFHLIQYFYIL